MSSCVVCPICCEVFKSGDDVYGTSCGHIYHYHCMQQWKRNSTSCPQCRAYNPTTQKLYLSFEPGIDDEKHVQELKTSLEQAQKNFSNAQFQLDEKERDLTNLKNLYETKVTELSLLESQLTENEDKLIKLNSQLDESIFNGSRIEQELEILKREYLNFNEDNATGDAENIINLKYQINYFKRQIEAKDEALNALQVAKIKLEERLKQANKENVNVEWQTKHKVLEQRLKLLNEQLMEEVKKNTELSLEKMKDKICGAQKVSNVESTSGQTQPVNPAKEDEDSASSMSRTDSVEDVTRTVVIKGLNNSITKNNYKTVVMRLIKMMQLPITENDLVSVKLLENKQPKAGCKISLCVEFSAVSHKIMFLKYKAKLRTFPDTIGLVVYEYNTDKTLTMYHFAAVLRNYGYKVYCRQNNVYVSKPNTTPIKIFKTQQVHDIIRQTQQSSRGFERPLSSASHNNGSMNSLYDCLHFD